MVKGVGPWGLSSLSTQFEMVAYAGMYHLFAMGCWVITGNSNATVCWYARNVPTVSSLRLVVLYVDIVEDFFKYLWLREISIVKYSSGRGEGDSPSNSLIATQYQRLGCEFNIMKGLLVPSM